MPKKSRWEETHARNASQKEIRVLFDGFQVAISKFQDSHQDPGQGFKLQFPSFKIHTEIQVRVSRCNFQVSRFTPRSGSGFQVAISKFQVSRQDPGQGFKLQFPSFKIQTKIQARVSSCNFQVSLIFRLTFIIFF